MGKVIRMQDLQPPRDITIGRLGLMVRRCEWQGFSLLTSKRYGLSSFALFLGWRMLVVVYRPAGWK
jgi:hypothetical protein